MADSIVYGAGIIALTALGAFLSQLFVGIVRAGISAVVFIRRLKKAVQGRPFITSPKDRETELTGFKKLWAYLRIWTQFTFSPPDCIDVITEDNHRVSVYYPGREDDTEEHWPA